MIFEEQLDDMKQILGNIGLHLNYNHPQEAVKMLNTLIGKAQDLKDEVEDQ